LLLLIAGCLVGCDHLKISATETGQPYVHKADEFLPLDAGTANSTYTVDGTKTNYVLKTVKTGTTVNFQATSDGKVVDEEVYDVKDNSILLKSAAGENFNPPVVLVKFPLYVGDQYTWKGSLCCEIEKIEGSATVTTSTDFVQGKDNSSDAIKAEMNLKFGEGASRKLSFWFVNGKGIVKTEILKNVRGPKI
jgi:hypothetical protein